MHFDIRRMRRYGKSPWTCELRQSFCIPGRRVDQDGLTSPLNRPTRIAEILKTSPGESILPTLHDAQIHGMATNALVITGIEFIDGVAYSQSWHCRVA
ncbi:hypothetical protein R4K01_28775 [Pseudomonas aeruginosa]|jgi:hypothetical protein|uniref:hypothetical protein n=1 Tax=Pseudomonas aeruginosa TaxID=287 RepID=UPI0008FBAD30|nr:hypothetical protein [Pseudomonas aeruginosa]MBG5056933.1 hypothetical protein [Pseudomonas aeruginosa]MBG5702942.1 hypothetical protein [Pseudomonas aeruginosa]MBM2500168.1 hypothetical protein [Pseudomonas aeruginosa]MBP8401344.1 hypothetical protein [Pseudomonas aeruginosa]MBP8407851.1 hypothetical protein [Pseudomonas aeruginosa]